MRDETLVEPFAVPEIYVDGVDHLVSNGMMIASGYRIMPPTRRGAATLKVVAVRLILPVTCVAAAMADAQHALSAPLLIAGAGLRLARH